MRWVPLKGAEGMKDLEAMGGGPHILINMLVGGDGTKNLKCGTLRQIEDAKKEINEVERKFGP